MDFELLVFVVLVFTTFFNNGVQAYIHFEAYPLFSHVAKSEFPTYVSEYERRLTIPLLLPYGVTVLANIVALFARPEDVSLIWLIAALILNVSVAVVTLRVATPVYNEIKAAGEATAATMGRLMQINLWRLVLSTLSSIVLLYLLLDLLSI
ncbi:MAG: hypothetical protein L0154_02060 [Chloroflexi bacterium]|nr:hypothetical protein [Chloroflexota bacterium]